MAAPVAGVPVAAAPGPVVPANDPAYQTDAAGWRRRVAQRPLDDTEQRELIGHLQRSENENVRGEAELQQLETRRRELERAKLMAVQTSIRRLPHHTRYSRTRVDDLANDNPVRQHLIDEFQRTATRHRGPAPDDPLRQAPKFEVRLVQQIFNPRAQEAYMSELQDVAGLCEQRVAPLAVAALKVQSDEQLDLNEFMLYHGAPAHLFQRLANQGLDPRYAGLNAGRMARCCEA